MNSGIVGSATCDEGTMPMNCETPQTDRSMSNSVDMPVATLRRASGHDLTSYGYWEQEMQMPPMEDTTCVTFELAEVRCSILSVPTLVANGHRVIYRGRGDELRTAKRAVAPLTHVRGLWYLHAARQRCSMSYLPSGLGSVCEPREQAASVVDQDDRTWRARAHRGGCA